MTVHFKIRNARLKNIICQSCDQILKQLIISLLCFYQYMCMPTFRMIKIIIKKLHIILSLNDLYILQIFTRNIFLLINKNKNIFK